MPQSPVLRPRSFSSFHHVVAGFSTRHGGVSAPPYDTLNLGVHVGDDETCVEENRRRFCEALDTDPAWIATARQVHGNTVRVVDGPKHVPFCDGMVTDTPGVLLAVTAADCAAVLLVDAEAEVAGACHSGWRGTVAEIAIHTVEEMTGLGAAPERIHAYVSPCISVTAFEVGPEVAEQFDDAFVEERAEWEKPHVDLKACLRAQLEGTGVPGPQIEVSPHCTAQETDDFFSYRATGGGPTGTMCGAIRLRS
jgi:YfiH family protein